MEILYFTWLLPFKCYDNSLIFSELVSLNIGFMTWLNSIFYMSFFEFCYREDELTMQAKALGYWKQISIEQVKSLEDKFCIS